MNILKGVLLEEYKRLKKLGKLYKGKIKELAKGSISVKIRRGKSYGYLAYWENHKVKFKYLGEISSDKVKEAKRQVVERKKYSSMLKKVNSDLKHINKVLNGRKI